MAPIRTFLSWDAKYNMRQKPTDGAFLACYATGDVAVVTKDNLDSMALPTTKLSTNVIQFLLYNVFNAAWERNPQEDLSCTILPQDWISRWNNTQKNTLPQLLQLANPLEYRWIIWPVGSGGHWFLMIVLNAFALMKTISPGPNETSGTSRPSQWDYVKGKFGLVQNVHSILTNFLVFYHR